MATTTKPSCAGIGHDHREEPADDPQELEAGLEPGERAAVVRVGRVALDDRIEREPARRSRRHRPSARAPLTRAGRLATHSPRRSLRSPAALTRGCALRTRPGGVAARSARRAARPRRSRRAPRRSATSAPSRDGRCRRRESRPRAEPLCPIDSPTGTGASLPPPFRANASRNVRKPTMPRSSPIASAACTMPAPRSSTSSAVSGGSSARPPQPTDGWRAPQRWRT